ncbi:MAG TPA: carboxypeptidase regulatory-like domain-containing protein, partial [Saprospiraceae bacterium]|nr:carboxypeptidase regulatory-like domain-containing protein [Saprospiraceae bacterium]
SVITLTGTVRTESGMPIPGVRVWLESMLADTATTGASGEFTFPLLDAGMDYTLGFLKDTHHSNGVSTQDVIRIQRQILSIENLNSAYKQFAADVNQSGNVSTLDVILLRRIILTIMDKFPDVSSWQFFPANHTFADPLHPFGELTPNRVPLGMLTGSISINITGVKSGDVNESADPSN